MTLRIASILLAMGILYGTSAWAQTDAADTGTLTQPAPKPAFTYPDATPSLDFLNGAVENSSITLGIGGGFAYSSNAFSSSRPSPEISRVDSAMPHRNHQMSPL